MQFTTIFTKEIEGWYTVEVLELPWCLTYWNTLEEAETMIKDAIKWYLQSMKKHWENFNFQKKSIFISSIPIYETI